MNATNRTLGDIASDNPAASRVFLRHRLDFCCGGQRTLAQACRQAGLEAAEIAREIELESARREELPGWDKRPPAELADHIEQHYHQNLRRDVPALIAAARRVEKVHAGKPNVPAGLAALLTEFWEEMQQHMMKEERVLFPMLRQGARGEAVYGPVRVMESEHQVHGQVLAAIRELTDDFAIPPHACATWSAMVRGLEVLEADLMQHVHLENNILFLRAVRDA
jgi:regulator of cell morphogenesis and NO signaling